MLLSACANTQEDHQQRPTDLIGDETQNPDEPQEMLHSLQSGLQKKQAVICLLFRFRKNQFYSGGGQLLDARTSPLGQALTEYQCLQYVLDKPGVLTVLPGIRGKADLNRILGFLEATSEEKL